MSSKVCTKCSETKGLDNFYPDPRYCLGVKSQCKACDLTYASKHRKGTAVGRKTWLWAEHRITPERYEEILNSQGGVCRICGKDEKPLCIDHDHSCCPAKRSCGSCIRGLLCQRCNKVLGFVEDDIDLLHELISYLR